MMKMKKIFFSSVLVLSFLLISLSTQAMAKTMNILVYPFENTGDKQYSWISAGMTDTVINDLMEIKRSQRHLQCRPQEDYGGDEV